MERRIAPIIIVTVSFLAVIALLAILKGATRAGDGTGQYADPALLFSFVPAGPSGVELFVHPTRQGAFNSAGESTDFTFAIKNTGDTLTDIFEIVIDSVWPTELFQSDRTTPLNDSNNDGRTDTSSLLPGQTIYLIARINAPSAASIGDDNRSMLIVTSSNDPLVEETILLQSAIPSSFLQAFRDDGLNYPSIFLTQADNQRSQVISTPEGKGSEIAIAETVSGYIYVWSHQRIEGNVYVTEIESIMMDKEGKLTSGSTKITDHSGVMLPIHDVKPVVAVDPHGNIGISWKRLHFDQDWNVNSNVFVRILNQEGLPITDATNLTHNAQWGIQGAIGLPGYDSPRIAPLAESGFFAAWQHEQQENQGSIQDIYFSALSEDGNLVISPTNLTNDIPDANGNVAPALAGLSTNRTLLSWVNRRPGNDDVLIVVIDSQGNIVHGPKDISADEDVTDWWNFDAVELSNGSIMVVWQAWGCIEGEFTGRIRFAILSSNYRRIGKPSCMGPDGIATGGDKGVSVTADAYEHGIVTWTDQDFANRRQLYYSLIDKRGNIVTEPLAFYRSATSDGLISLNAEGYANTSRIFIDGVASFNKPLFFAKKGEQARITIRYGNMGTLATGALTLTTTLNNNLTYQSDTAPGKPTINGNIISWDFTNLEPAEGVQFDLYSTLPETTTVGASYPVSVTVELQLTESDLFNNSDIAQVIVSQPLFLPFILR